MNKQNEKERTKTESTRQYIIIGAVVIVALACIGAFTFLIGQIAGIPVITPTDTPLPPPVVNIQAIRAQAQLSTVKYNTVTEVYNETPPEGIIDEFLGNKEKLLMLVYGEVQAGFDLAKLDEDDIWTDGTRVRLVLPPPEILTTSVDFERTHVVYYEDSLIFDNNNPNLQGDALEQAQEAIEKAALSEGVLEQANDFGQLYFENFLHSAGFTDVEVVVDAQIFEK